jgi:hypothetical protein
MTVDDNFYEKCSDFNGHPEFRVVYTFGQGKVLFYECDGGLQVASKALKLLRALIDDFLVYLAESEFDEAESEP